MDSSLLELKKQIEQWCMNALHKPLCSNSQQNTFAITCTELVKAAQSFPELRYMLDSIAERVSLTSEQKYAILESRARFIEKNPNSLFDLDLKYYKLTINELIEIAKRYPTLEIALDYAVKHIEHTSAQKLTLLLTRCNFINTKNNYYALDLEKYNLHNDEWLWFDDQIEAINIATKQSSKIDCDLVKFVFPKISPTARKRLITQLLKNEKCSCTLFMESCFIYYYVPQGLDKHETCNQILALLLADNDINIVPRRYNVDFLYVLKTATDFSLKKQIVLRFFIDFSFSTSPTISKRNIQAFLSACRISKIQEPELYEFLLSEDNLPGIYQAMPPYVYQQVPVYTRLNAFLTCITIEPELIGKAEKFALGEEKDGFINININMQNGATSLQFLFPHDPDEENDIDNIEDKKRRLLEPLTKLNEQLSIIFPEQSPFGEVINKIQDFAQRTNSAYAYKKWLNICVWFIYTTIKCLQLCPEKFFTTNASLTTLWLEILNFTCPRSRFLLTKQLLSLSSAQLEIFFELCAWQYPGTTGYLAKDSYIPAMLISSLIRMHIDACALRTPKSQEVATSQHSDLICKKKKYRLHKNPNDKQTIMHPWQTILQQSNRVFRDGIKLQLIVTGLLTLLTDPKLTVENKLKHISNGLLWSKSREVKAIQQCKRLWHLFKALPIMQANLLPTEDINNLPLSKAYAITVERLFGVKADHMKYFNKNFHTISGELIAYHAGLCKLPIPERTAFVSTLKSFVQAVATLNASVFYRQRYDIKNNLHLQAVFKDRDALYVWWTKNNPSLAYSCFIEHFALSSCKPRNIDMVHFLSSQIAHNHLPQATFPHIHAYIKGDFLEKRLLKEKLKKIRQLAQSDVEKNKTQAQLQTICLFESYNAVADDEKKLLLKKLQRFLNLCGNYEFCNDLQIVYDNLSLHNNKKHKEHIEEWQITVTDNHKFLFVLGNVEGSCQRTSGDPNLNKCLLGYVCGGYVKAVVIYNAQNEIQTRAILRLMLDTNRNIPVLFLETIYPYNTSFMHQEAIRTMAKLVSYKMHLKLLVVKDIGTYIDLPPYPNKIEVLQQLQAPAEYSDANHGIQTGPYSIDNPCLLYDPDPHYQQLVSQASIGLVANASLNTKVLFTALYNTQIKEMREIIHKKMQLTWSLMTRKKTTKKTINHRIASTPSMR